MLYSHDKVNTRKPAFTILPNDNATIFRWIHLPANNMAWVEALLTKLFIEEGTSDIDGFKALERSFSHQHRGQQSHSHFMRPLCQNTPRAPQLPEVDPPSTTTEQPPPTIVLNGVSTSNEDALPRSLTRTSTSASGDDKSKWTKTSAQPSTKDQGKGLPKDKSKKATIKGNKSPKGDYQNLGKNQQRKPRHLQAQNRNPRFPVFPSRKEATHISKGNVYTFMPYLHFETKQRCQEMQQAIKAAESMKTPHSRQFLKGKILWLPFISHPGINQEI